MVVKIQNGATNCFCEMLQEKQRMILFGCKLWANFPSKGLSWALHLRPSEHSSAFTASELLGSVVGKTPRTPSRGIYRRVTQRIRSWKGGECLFTVPGCLWGFSAPLLSSLSIDLVPVLGSSTGVIWAVQTRVAEGPSSASRQAGNSKQQRFISLKVREDLQSIHSIAI